MLSNAKLTILSDINVQIRKKSIKLQKSYRGNAPFLIFASNYLVYFIKKT